MTENELIITEESVKSKILTLRDVQVMLDSDLALLYKVDIKRLNEQVKRNKERFPVNFMFQLTDIEYNSLRSQFATLEKGRGTHRKYLPFAFTEQGVAMLSGVLNSNTAIDVNIQIIRVFTRMRKLIVEHKDLLLKLDDIEKKLMKHSNHLKKHEEEIQRVFQTIKRLLNPDHPPMKRVGYRRKEDTD